MEDNKNYHFLIVTEDTEKIKKYSLTREKIRIYGTIALVILLSLIVAAGFFMHDYLKVAQNIKPAQKKYIITKNQNLKLRQENEKLYNKLRMAQLNFISWKKNVNRKLRNINSKIGHISRLYNIDKPIGGIEDEKKDNDELILKMLENNEIDVLTSINGNINRQLGSLNWILIKEQRYIIKRFIYNRGLKFLVPVKNPRITSYYGKRWDPFNGYYLFHRGVDYGGSHGTPVFASENGRVLWAGNVNQYGKIVIINHSAHVSTRYAHLSSISVKNNQRVNKGDLIGFIGSSGRATASHLHFEVRINGEVIDPLNIL